MGFRFNGEKIESRRGTDIISDGIAPGSVQIPPAGTPIIMMADRQTTGGYAKIGTVISADLPVLAQAVPGMKIRFRFVTCGEAVSALEALEQKLHILEGGGCD
jgi:allophanate hydrolase subunit 2